jgi:hypothetical protein
MIADFAYSACFAVPSSSGHRLIARNVLADPALPGKARENVRRWQDSNGGPHLALAEWEQILGGPVDRVAQRLSWPSERASADAGSANSPPGHETSGPMRIQRPFGIAPTVRLE